MYAQAMYREKLRGPEEALSHIQSNQRVFVGCGAGVPQVLVDTLPNLAQRVRNVEFVHALNFSPAPYVDPQFDGVFRHNAVFIGANTRPAVQAGRADFTPAFLFEIPGLFHDGSLPFDVALLSLSPPDAHGFCSYGVEVGLTKPAAEAAKLVIAEINPQMPRTMGNSFIHLSQIDYLVEVDYPLVEAPQGQHSDLSLTIGQYIADLIPNGATLQMGLGSIPDAVLSQLDHHRDLSIHSELFSDGVIDLVEKGIINCARKSFVPDKIVAGFLFGSQRLYDFVDNNPLIDLHPTDFVNDPFNIAQNERMVAINGALQLDLTGQVCADSLGPRFYSGVGGQVDFIRGAARSKGGLPIIALPSTAKGDSLSRIVPLLTPGSGVTTSRNDVHYVVTEYGVANLHGKTIRQRAEALINIAHPNFRAELRAEAETLHYL